jgi:hypothetical protein
MMASEEICSDSTPDFPPKCRHFGTLNTIILHLFGLKTIETLTINRFYPYSASPTYNHTSSDFYRNNLTDTNFSQNLSRTKYLKLRYLWSIPIFASYPLSSRSSDTPSTTRYWGQRHSRQFPKHR